MTPRSPASYPFRRPGSAAARAATARLAAPLLLASLLALAATPPVARVVAEPELAVTSRGHAPSVALDGRKRGVVTWVSGASGQATAIHARRFEGNAFRGADFRVNTLAAGDLREPAVAMDARGGFLVAWQEASAPGADSAIRGRLFRANGSPRGACCGDLTLNPPGASSAHPRVAMAPDGRFAVGWEHSPADVGLTVRLATFRADGLPLGRPVPMNGAGVTANLVGAVSAGPASVALGWTEVSPCPQMPIDPVSAVATFSWDLRPLGDVDRLANNNPCVDGPMVLALPGSDLGPLGIFVGRRYSIQRFSPLDGQRVGPRTNVAELPFCGGGDCERVVAVAGDPRGRFVFVWERVRHLAQGDPFDLFAELYGREGLRRLDRFPINNIASGAPEHPAAALGADGALVVVWERAGGLVMRKLQVP
ncbi:MAG TPA: hypothetical protein VGV61_11465 [Thermoanaerobaculia bacterium]|nr:hypothetical protein [Thermoanaerobaculia bacterium]